MYVLNVHSAKRAHVLNTNVALIKEKVLDLIELN